MEEIFGYVESLVFSSDTFTVARLKEASKKEFTYIIGSLAHLHPGETIRCKGTWKHHSQYGRQFEVEQFESKEPSDLIGIQKYLESGLVKGIGPTYAQRIVRHFGITTLQVIDNDPKRLLEVAGIGPKRVERIESCWKEQKAVRDIMVFLQSYGITPAYAQKIYRVYGNESMDKVRSDPFALARNITGIGFKMADQIAQQMGIPITSTTRVRAGIDHLLWELSTEGHTCYPRDKLLNLAVDLLQVPQEIVESELRGGQVEKALIVGTVEEGEGVVSVWNKPLYLAEIGIVRELNRLQSSISKLRKIESSKALEWVQNRLSLNLAVDQKQAVVASMEDKIHLITGGPGTGKSTITKAIVSIANQLTPHIFLAAPTGRAAKRMSEVTGKKASTLHALLGVVKGGGFKHNLNNQLEVDLLIIDEMSMVDTWLFYHLLKAIPSHCRLILIGDVDQLPSVGPGNVLKDLISSKLFKITRLTQIYRQSAHSKIVTNAHLINRGELPDLYGGYDFKFIAKEKPEDIVSTIVDLIVGKVTGLHGFRRDEIQILAPMKRGVIGTENLNVVLQRHLCPGGTAIHHLGRSFYIGDKVLQTRNNYEKKVFNGDIGKVTAIDTVWKTLTVSFEDTVVEYNSTTVNDLILAYAISIHRYQGSESPCVIIPIHPSQFKLIQRNLLYTAVTRGKKLVLLIGTQQAVRMAVKNDQMAKRHTGLASILIKSHSTLIPEFHLDSEQTPFKS